MKSANLKCQRLIEKSAWRSIKLKYLMGTSGSGTTPTDEDDFDEDGVPWVVTGELRERPIRDTERKVSSAALAKYSALQVHPRGSLLIAMYGATVGRLARLEVNAATNQACFAIHPTSALDLEFLGWWFEGFRDDLVSTAVGAGQPNISGDKIKNLMLSVPLDVEVQRHIAQWLNQRVARIDALIEKKARFIELLREKRQALITQAVTRGLDPGVPMKDSGVEWLGQVPAHWTTAPLKHLVRFASGGTPSKETREFWDGDVPWASAKDLKLELLLDTEDHITTHAVDIGAASLIPAGSVLVVVRGMILARTFPVTVAGVPMAINQDLKAIVAGPRLQGDFLAYLLRGTAQLSLARLEEAAHGTKALRMDAWVDLELPVPPLGEQTEIVGHLEQRLDRIDQLVHHTASSIALLRERRAALITAAVTGQIDVREAA